MMARERLEDPVLSWKSYLLFINGTLPKNFGSDYLKSERNKEDLYALMSEYFLESFTSADIVVTSGRRTVSNSTAIEMSESSHLEADFRIVTHIIDGIIGMALKRLLSEPVIRKCSLF